MLDGEPHWDGGYSANPPILPLVFDDASAADTLLVPLVPMRWTETPTELPQIRQRLAELTFNSRFLAELGTLAQWQDDLRWPRRGRHERMLARAHWHIVDGASALEAMATETRLIAHAPFLEHLRDLGRERAKAWIADHAGAVGRRSSVDLLSLLGARD
jgi:NTE family protein